jgi:AcrR family transcriptional regulator
VTTATPGDTERRLRPRGQQTRARLLDAGLEVFAKKGFHAARVDDIVKVASTSHGTFYLYFASKEVLFEALVQDAATDMSVLIDSLPTRIRNDAAGRAALRSWVGQFADLYSHSGGTLRVWAEAELSGDRMSGIGDDLMGSLAAAIASRVTIPRRTGLDPAIATLALIAMCERLMYYGATGQLKADPDVIVDTIADIIADALLS